MSTIADMRKPYKGEGDIFGIDDLVSREPYAQFQHWFKIACETSSVMEANAMSVATATKEGKPSLRVILMKGFDKKGIVFYTNFHSRKGRELEENPFITVNFYWTNSSENVGDTWARQVRIEGVVEKIPEEESEAYFRSRPIPSQIGACVSNQSTRIANREVLTNRKRELEREYLDGKKPVPKPPHWGGYLIKPDMFEFWQGQTNRIHDRIVFRKQKEGEVIDPSVTQVGEEGWLIERLSP